MGSSIPSTYSSNRSVFASLCWICVVATLLVAAICVRVWTRANPAPFRQPVRRSQPTLRSEVSEPTLTGARAPYSLTDSPSLDGPDADYETLIGTIAGEQDGSVHPSLLVRFARLGLSDRRRFDAQSRAYLARSHQDSLVSSYVLLLRGLILGASANHDTSFQLDSSFCQCALLASLGAEELPERCADAYLTPLFQEIVAGVVLHGEPRLLSTQVTCSIRRGGRSEVGLPRHFHRIEATSSLAAAIGVLRHAAPSAQELALQFLLPTTDQSCSSHAEWILQSDSYPPQTRLAAMRFLSQSVEGQERLWSAWERGALPAELSRPTMEELSENPLYDCIPRLAVLSSAKDVESRKAAVAGLCSQPDNILPRAMDYARAAIEREPLDDARRAMLQSVAKSVRRSKLRIALLRQFLSNPDKECRVIAQDGIRLLENRYSPTPAGRSRR